MYTLDEIPTEKDKVMGRLYPDHDNSVEGVVGVKSGYEIIRLFPDALKVLQNYWNNEYGPTTRIAAASSADTPRAVKIGRSAMGLLEIVPGVTMREVFAKGWSAGFEGNVQIGRTPPM
jgi:magnesium-dependent phosphatase 1